MRLQVGNPRLPWALGEPTGWGTRRERKTGRQGTRKGNGQQKGKGNGEATGCWPASESDPAGKQLRQLPDGETEDRMAEDCPAPVHHSLRSLYNGR